MNNETISWLLAVEFALPFIILSLILIWSTSRQSKKNKEAVRNLILKIKNGESSRKSELREFLVKKVKLDEAAAKIQTKKIINERKFLFRNLISSLLDKNAEALVGLESDLARLTKHYHQLDIAPQPPAAGGEVEDDEDDEDVEALRSEIKSLKHEVHITLTTLNNIFGEFSSMFGEEVPDREMSVDQIINAMESFSSKSSVNKEVETTEEEEGLDAFVDSDEEDAFSATDEIEELDEIEEVEDMAELEEESDPSSSEPVVNDSPEPDEELDFSIDSELDDIDSALDQLELGNDDVIERDKLDDPDSDEEETDDEMEPSWDDAFEESGDKKD